MSITRMQQPTPVFEGRTLSCESGKFRHQSRILQLASGRVAADALTVRPTELWL